MAVFPNPLKALLQQMGDGEVAARWMQGMGVGGARSPSALVCAASGGCYYKGKLDCLVIK